MNTGFAIGDRGLGSSGDTHPFWISGHAEVEGYRIVGASVVGQIHLARNMPRDDAFLVRSVGPWVAVGVADGVGTRHLSRYGATYVVESLTALLLRPFAKPLHSQKTAIQTNRLQTPSLSIDGLVPPQRAEDVTLKSPYVPPGSGSIGIKQALAEWNQNAQGESFLLQGSDGDPVVQNDAITVPHGALTALLQAGSVSWWPPISPISHSPSPPLCNDLDSLHHKEHDDFDAVDSELEVKPNVVEILEQAFERTHLGLRDHATSLGLELADLSCTALALLINLDTGCGVVGQVGDGAILGMTERGKVLELVRAPDTGDPQATYTLNRPNFQKYLAKQIVESTANDPFRAFYVMTDGLSSDLLYSPQPAALRSWAQAVDRNIRISSTSSQAAAGMSNWLASYQVKGSWDDRTLVVIAQKEQRNGYGEPTVKQSEPAESTDDQ